MAVPVWGWSKPGTKVTVEFAGQKTTATAGEDGKWTAELKDLKAGFEPRELVIREGAGKTETLSNILVGEVWMASGQSNMQWVAGKSSVSKLAQDLAAETAGKVAPIREFQVSSVTSQLHPIKKATGAWKNGNYSDYSAIAFAFAHKLYKELNVPVGILNCSFSQTAIQAWVPREGFASAEDDYSKAIHLRCLQTDPTTPEHKEAWDAFYRSLEDQIAASEAAIATGGEAKEISAPVPGNLSGNRDASWLFNGRLSPVVSYAIRGAIWNQGYANMGEGLPYYNNLHNLVRGWRIVWDKPELPVYFHQFYSPGNGVFDGKPSIDGTAEMRLGTWLARDIPHAAMASQIDIQGAIHYQAKVVPGQRLALHALKNQYGQKDLVTDGPMFKSYQVKGDKVIVEFDHAEGGLVVAETGSNATGKNAGGEKIEDATGFADPKIIPNGDDCKVHFEFGPETGPAVISKIIDVTPEMAEWKVVLPPMEAGPVLLIESSMGNRALNWDFRPPSSGKTEEEKANEWCGKEYDLMVEGVHKTLKNIDKIVPDYQGHGYEIAGFVWWQGHKDKDVPKEVYEKHLVNLIQELRKEFKTPEMPAVVATVGFGGMEMDPGHFMTWEAQMAVGDPQQHPEFAGKVASVDTRPFWRSRGESPTNTGFHYNHNAETYVLTGDALGRAMVILKGGQAEKLTIPPRPQQHPDVETIFSDAVTGNFNNAGPHHAPDYYREMGQALKPIIMDEMVPGFIEAAFAENSRGKLKGIVTGAKPAKMPLDIRSDLDTLMDYYDIAGVEGYEWKPFGPEMRTANWSYFSFDPPEKQDLAKSNRYRKITFPEGMENWFAPEFDPVKAGWKTGQAPFGQMGGKLDRLRPRCSGPLCGCSEIPATLWEKEVLLMRQTFDVPPVKEGHAYRLILGGAGCDRTGEGFAIHVNGKPLTQVDGGFFRNSGVRGAYLSDDILSFSRDHDQGLKGITIRDFTLTPVK